MRVQLSSVRNTFIQSMLNKFWVIQVQFPTFRRKKLTIFYIYLTGSFINQIVICLTPTDAAKMRSIVTSVLDVGRPWRQCSTVSDEHSKLYGYWELLLMWKRRDSSKTCHVPFFCVKSSHLALTQVKHQFFYFKTASVKNIQDMSVIYEWCLILLQSND